MVSTSKHCERVSLTLAYRYATALKLICSRKCQQKMPGGEARQMLFA